jgi:hypothetical protein
LKWVVGIFQTLSGHSQPDGKDRSVIAAATS